jgi:hypothetical protein
LPYCWKCGAELKEDDKFCPACGTPVGAPKPEPERRMKRKPISTLAIVLIVLFVSAAVIVAIALMPIRAVDITESRDVPYQTGVDTLDLDFMADVAQVNVAFEDLSGKLVTLDMSVTGRVGVFGSLDVLDLAFDSATDGNVLTVTSEVDIVSRYSWSLNVTCRILIDPSMKASLDVKTSTGGIVLNTQAGVALDYVSLEATTGGVEAKLVEDVRIDGDISLMTTTGGVKLSWDNVIAANDVLVNAMTTTGGVDVDINQDEELARNITLRGEATTGGVDLTIAVQDDVGAKIESSVTTGGIDIDRQVGFSGVESSLQSDNYPADTNFDVTLKTITGGIDIDAEYAS